MGTANNVIIGDDAFHFNENIFSNFAEINEKNLLHCKYLNLRHSTVKFLNTEYLLFVNYIDISFSLIDQIDLNKCDSLDIIAIDMHQLVQNANKTKVEILYDT